MSTLAICYGNTLRGNDSFGFTVYTHIHEKMNSVFSHQLLPELAEIATRYDTLLFVDASIGSGKTHISRIAPSTHKHAHFHAMDAQTFLSFIQSIYGVLPHAYLCTAFFEYFDEQPDESFEQKIKDALALLEDFLPSLSE